MLQCQALGGLPSGSDGEGMGLISPIQANEGGEFSRFMRVHTFSFWCSQLQAAGHIVRGMGCRHLSMHGCNFESGRPRKVSSCSLARKIVTFVGRSDSKLRGMLSVSKLFTGCCWNWGENPAPAGEQLRRSYIIVRPHIAPTLKKHIT